MVGCTACNPFFKCFFREQKYFSCLVVPLVQCDASMEENIPSLDACDVWSLSVGPSPATILMPFFCLLLCHCMSCRAKTYKHTRDPSKIMTFLKTSIVHVWALSPTNPLMHMTRDHSNDQKAQFTLNCTFHFDSELTSRALCQLCVKRAFGPVLCNYYFVTSILPGSDLFFDFSFRKDPKACKKKQEKVEEKWYGVREMHQSEPLLFYSAVPSKWQLGCTLANKHFNLGTLKRGCLLSHLELKPVLYSRIKRIPGRVTMHNGIGGMLLRISTFKNSIKR